MAIEVLPLGERLPLFGSFKPNTSDTLGQFLRLRPMLVAGETPKFDWAAPPAVGAPVELRLATRAAAQRKA
jgi:hypothetical protein